MPQVFTRVLHLRWVPLLYALSFAPLPQNLLDLGQ